METGCTNRLTVVGSKRMVRKFTNQQDKWELALGARHGEFLQNSPGRYVCQFDTRRPPQKELQKLSLVWPRLSFVLEFDLEEKRIKGLAKFQRGETESCVISY